MLPVIKVWCLPHGQDEAEYNRLHQAIVTAMSGIPELGIKDEKDLCVLFPRDLMAYGLGAEIIVEISRLTNTLEANLEVRRSAVAEAVGKAVFSLYPRANVQCRVEPPSPKHLYWSSKGEQ